MNSQNLFAILSMIFVIASPAIAESPLWLQYAETADAAYKKHDKVAQQKYLDAAIDEVLKLPPHSVHDSQGQLLMTKLTFLSEGNEPSSAPESEAEISRRITRLRRLIGVQDRMIQTDPTSKQVVDSHIATWKNEIATYEKLQKNIKH